MSLWKRLKMPKSFKTDADQNQTDEKDRSALTVQNIYVKDISFKAPNSPHIFREVWKPKVDLNVNLSSQVLSEEANIYEVVLQATVTIKSGEETAKEAFVATVEQAGVFTIKVKDNEILDKVLQITCPTLLYPYVQELLSNIATRGGFPKLMLPPFISFDVLYEKSLEKKNK